MLGTKSKTSEKGNNEKLVLIPTPALKHPEAAIGLGVFFLFFVFFPEIEKHVLCFCTDY